jgi:hypothetical protein
VSAPNLEDVFKLSGIPTVTFVKPVEYERLLVALRTPGRGVIIEGPSGIGKTTAVTQALSELALEKSVLSLSARKEEDRKLIGSLPEMKEIGVVMVDDFHRLDVETKRRVADYLKTLADEESKGSKVIVVGINKAGETLIDFASDLADRIEIIPFEANPTERVQELVDKGEAALNVDLAIASEIVESATGSFYITQMLCHEACLTDGVRERQDEHREVVVSFELIRERVMIRLERSFGETAIKFAAGTKLRREGRAPYLHILKWLAEANEWSISLDREMGRHPELKGSVGQVIEKGFLDDLIQSNPTISSVIHLESQTGELAVEDPKFVFYLRNISWPQFTKKVGYVNIDFEARYDIALSFAGTDRPIAQRLFELLSEMEFEVFYDKHEQHRILAENIEEYLGPIYRSDAAFVLCLLGPDFPTRIWTKFESRQFKERFGAGRVIPIWFTTSPPGMFDESTKVGGISFDPNKDHEKQLREIADLVGHKVADVRRTQGDGT